MEEASSFKTFMLCSRNQRLEEGGGEGEGEGEGERQHLAFLTT